MKVTVNKTEDSLKYPYLASFATKNNIYMVLGDLNINGDVKCLSLNDGPSSIVKAGTIIYISPSQLNYLKESVTLSN